MGSFRNSCRTRVSRAHFGSRRRAEFSAEVRICFVLAIYSDVKERYSFASWFHDTPLAATCRLLAESRLGKQTDCSAGFVVIPLHGPCGVVTRTDEKALRAAVVFLDVRGGD
jgi:hypothetical protein